jgi:hypothetical protein
MPPEKGSKKMLNVWKGLTARLLFVGALASGVGVASAQNHCTLKSVRGTYVFTASGHNIVSGVPQPKAILEVIVLNGDGTLSVPAATTSINGFIVRSEGAGTYTVSSQCTGTISFAGGPSFDIFVSGGGKLLWMIQTNPNTVFQGTATRTSRKEDD